ncbi:hypothetical protein LTR29_018337, partial [Friedmanniomyces endolithicus]
MDLAAIFDQPPEASMSDFTITANTESSDDDGISEADSHPRFSVNSTSSQMFVSDSEAANVSQPIHVHKMILQARWPHFKRL